MRDEVLLAIDNGTQSVRALLFDLRGNLVGKSQVKLDTYECAQPGWMEHSADAFWAALCKACHALWHTTAVKPMQVRALVVTTQRGTVINLDKQGKVLRPAIIWADQRLAQANKHYGLLWETAFLLAGLRDTVTAFERQAEAVWIAQNQPELWAQTDKFLLLSGYLHYRLTGEMVDAVGNQVGYVPFDYKKGAWAAPGDWKWKCLSMTPSMMPTLVPNGTVIGKISAAASADTGLPAGMTVVAGASDKACEVIGAGSLAPEIACLSYGTTATINTNTPRYVEAVPFIPPYPSAVPGYYNTEIQITRGYWMVSWFAAQFGLNEQIRAEKAGVSPEHFFDELLHSVPAGSQGLVLQPYWNPGVRIPGPEARGGIIGFSEVHTRAHLYRAIIEGLAYALREAGERIAKRSKTPLRLVRVAGGGSQSNAAMQITADIFNLPTERPALYEASGLGAAILASVGLGLHPDFATAVREMTRVGQRFEPIADHAQLYEQLYRSVYQRMYPRLQPLYRALRDVVGGNNA